MPVKELPKTGLIQPFPAHDVTADPQGIPNQDLKAPSRKETHHTGGARNP